MIPWTTFDIFYTAYSVFLFLILTEILKPSSVSCKGGSLNFINESETNWHHYGFSFKLL